MPALFSITFAMSTMSVLLLSCTPETSIRPDGDLAATVKRVDCATVTPTVTVLPLGLAYDPTPAVVRVDAIVKFVMPPQHNVTSETSGLDVAFGATTCLQFPIAGIYSFACAAHNFSGSVVVE